MRGANMTTRHRRASVAVALLLGAGVFSLTVGDVGKTDDSGFVPSAHAQPLRKLIARLRGQKLPAGVVKAEGRLEATQVDVSSKYPGRLAEISVEEGSEVVQGQVIARVSSPEFEAQLRAAQSDLQTAKDGLASAQAEIASRQAALEFAKSDFERGQELMKTGFITKQLFEERQRNYQSADAAVKNMTAQRDEAQRSIQIAEAKVQQVESMIHDLTLVSPRNGRVQYQLLRKGETVAVGAPILTILDLTDVYMVIFLHSADAGRLEIGDEARIILDAVPDYVIPAKVRFVASESQFTPKTVETADERAKLMFRVELRIDRQDLQRYYGKVGPGLSGAGFVLTSRDAKWPAELQVKLPPAPVVSAAPTPATVAEASPASAPAHAPAAESSTSTPASAPSAQSPTPANAPAAEAPAASVPAPASAAESSASTSAPAPVAEASRPSPSALAPVAESSTPTSAPAPVAEAPAPAPAAEEPTPALGPVAKEPTPDSVPPSLAQLTGAWASSADDCARLFQRRGEALAYRQPVDRFARAAIVDAQRIRLPSSTCRVERASPAGGALKLSADCQDSISYTTRTVDIKLRSNSEIVYSPTGDPDLDTTLRKCAL
jgi:HlyD family secretion protein